ncbi:DUF3800 domain-containing protein [Pseudoalteromonas marina]|uniref:DUF3800 domain-containing protein n=1 Tax=Pseudoalteromonas marina TaxID=267375 RepID=UPI0023EF8E71|nr:DUF3800 domain-containing protein [Pseudoalteromonas marina]
MSYNNPSFDSEQNYYTFYYDESNNVRTLSLNDGSYNIDNDKNQSSSVNFILAGLAHKGDTYESNVAELIESLKLQPTAKELKFNQIAKGEFDKALNSKKLNTFLEWVLKSDFYIHYFNLNMEYWSFIDLVDDIFFYLLQQNVLNANDVNRRLVDSYKDALYRLIRLDKLCFLKLMWRFNYPNIQPNYQKKFLIEINKLLKNNLRYSQIQKKGISEQTQLAFRSLSELIELSSFSASIEFAYDSDSSTLINAFNIFYSARSQSFINSNHIFDKEDSIEPDFNLVLQHDSELTKISYSFVDSKTSIPVQLSDVIAGIFNKYFSFIDKYSIEELQQIKAGFNDFQYKNLQLLEELVNKSDNECKEFLFYVMSLGEYDKHRQLLFS